MKGMQKKILTLVLFICLAAVTCLGVACGGKGTAGGNSSASEEVQGMYFAETNVEITLDEEITLQVEGASGALAWSSNDESVAVVDENGKVTPLSVGATIIKAKSDNEEAMCRVEVIAARAEALLSVSTDKQSLALYEGDEYTLTTTVRDGATVVDAAVSYSSTDEATATVSEDGKVKGIKAGNAEIILSVSYGGKTAERKITVAVAAVKPVLAVNLAALQVETGESLLLSASLLKKTEVLEEDLADVRYAVSDENYAIVNGNTLVGLKKGYVTLTATCEVDGETLETSLSVRIRERYTVIYLSDGERVATKSVLDGDTFKNDVTAPTKKDNRFDGWLLGNEKYDFGQPVEKDITLKAKWYPYDFAQSIYGAAVADTEGNVVSGAVTYGGQFAGGLHYALASKDVDYVVYLPCINYSEYTYVEYEWKVAGWCFIGPETSSRDFGTADYGGVITVINNKTSLLVEMTYTAKNLKFTRTVTDEEIINGTKSLNFSATPLADNRWFSLSAIVCSNEALPTAVAPDGTVVTAADSSVLEGGLHFNIGEKGSNIDWTITLDAMDYSAYSKVTYRFKGTAAWMSIGFIGGGRFNDSGNDSTPFDGTLTFTNRGNGKFLVELYDSVTTNYQSIELTDSEIVYGEKGFSFIVNNGAKYRTIHIGPAVTE